MKRRRLLVGLPPLQIHPYPRYDLANRYQYLVASDTQWPYAAIPAYGIQYGLAANFRSSTKATLLPSKLILSFEQPDNVQVRYRILLVKSTLSALPVTIAFQYPHRILRAATTKTQQLNDSYEEVEERSYPFRVLRDISFLFNTYDGKSRRRYFKLSVPGYTVTYDKDVPDGSQLSGALFLAITTEAPSQSANYTLALGWQNRYIC